MRRIAIVVALLAPALAHAHGHGGGGGGHGGGGHGGGGHGSSGGSGWHPSSGMHGGGRASGGGGTSAADDAAPCDPSLDVAALGACRAFGDWAVLPNSPHLLIDLGTVFRHMPSTLSLRGGTLHRSGERFPYRMRLSGARTGDSAVDFVLRIGGEVRPGVYVGAEGEVGGVAAFAPVDVAVDAGASGVPQFAQRHGFVDGAAGYVGVRERAGRAVVSLELAVGARGIVHAFRVRYAGVTGEQDLDDVMLVVEPRVRVDAWLSPYVTGGVEVGANAVELGDWSGGVFIGLHTRAFDGR
jgi:hypothetical protein